MNAYRRDFLKKNPDFNARHRKAYTQKHPDRIKEQRKKYNLDPEVKAARKAEREKIAAERKEAKKAEKAAIWAQKLAEQKEATRLRNLAKAEEKARLAPINAAKAAEIGRRNFAEYNAKKSAAAAIKKAERKEALERKRLIKKLIKLMQARATYLRKEEERARQDRHGVTTGDYDRCRRNNNGVACDLCRAAAAKYVREKFHSDPKYKEAEKRWKKANPDKAYRNKNKRRLKGGKHKSYTRHQIIKRDGHICYLCNRPVDLNANPVQGQPGWELYPHIEHVIPLAKGGDDTLDNVKLAHAICNINKGTKLLSELATS
jgi:5-methylcytosine-specific restriction endonuclease McrA